MDEMDDVIAKIISSTELATYLHVKKLFLSLSYDTAMDEVDRSIKELER